MIVGTVIGNVWATRKEESLNGLKLMVVQRVDLARGAGHGESESGGNPGSHDSFVAVDCVGAGIGERVLITTGNAARQALQNTHSPVDAVIIGILDQEEMTGSK